MIRTLAITKDRKLLKDIPLEKLSDPEIDWYWVDFNGPSEKEAMLLASHFHFHPLAIEDCFHFLQRPKVDFYQDYNFFVLHALNQKTLESEEMDMFVGKNYVVTFHFKALSGVETGWNSVLSEKAIWDKGIVYVVYMIIDKLVDEYFPVVYQIEDHLNDTEDNNKSRSIRLLMDEVFEIRSDLLKLRRTIIPMRELLYRIINSERLEMIKEHKVYFIDIYDHLLKLTEIIEDNREITADMRDSYLSLNSDRMNSIMMTLTIISSIFIPLTFIVGIYGMNFRNMPELNWHYGYFIVLGIMAVIGVSMFLWFKRKGWFDKL